MWWWRTRENLLKSVLAFADDADCDGVLTDNRVWLNENGIEAVAFSRADGLAFNALKKLNIKTIILSTETNKVIDERGQKLGIPVFQGVLEKEVFIHKKVEEENLKAKHIVYGL